MQTEILEKRFKGANKEAVTSDALDERKIEALNNGEAVGAIMKDEYLNRILDEMGNEPLDPARIKDRYLSALALKNTQENKNKSILVKAKGDMESAFGKQEPTEQAFDELIRYKHVLKEIRNDGIRVHYDNAKQALADIFAMKPTEAEKQPYREAFNAIKGNGPMGLDELNNAVNSKKAQLEAQAELGGPQL